MTSTQLTPAIAIPRVSTDGQDEESQIPELQAFADANGYDITGRIVPVHGQSAFHGKHLAQVHAAIDEHVAHGGARAVIFWKMDRSTRQGLDGAVALRKHIRDAGGKMLFASQPYLNGTDAASEMMFANLAIMAQEESRTKSDRIKIKQAALRSRGSAVGRPAWGFEIVCVDHADCDGKKCGHVKRFAPVEALRPYIVGIFDRVAEGHTLRQVAAWLDSEGVKTSAGNDRWHEAFIGNRLVKNQMYCGARKNGGAIEIEEIIPVSKWREANAALKARQHKRSTVKAEPALLSPICGNLACNATGTEINPIPGKSPKPSPMYRVKCGDTLYYRCTGRGGGRTGCGNMVRLDSLDAWITEDMAANLTVHLDRVFVAGTDNGAAIRKANRLAGEAMAKGDYDAATGHMAEAKRLTEAGDSESRWEAVGTARTEADYFDSLDLTAKRAYLAKHEIAATADGYTMVPAWMALAA